MVNLKCLLLAVIGIIKCQSASIDDVKSVYFSTQRFELSIDNKTNQIIDNNGDLETQWATINESNQIISCFIYEPSLCIHYNYNKPSTLFMIYNERLHDFSSNDNEEWDIIKYIVPSTKYTNHPQLPISNKRRLRGSKKSNECNKNCRKHRRKKRRIRARKRAKKNQRSRHESGGGHGSKIKHKLLKLFGIHGGKSSKPQKKHKISTHHQHVHHHEHHHHHEPHSHPHHGHHNHHPHHHMHDRHRRESPESRESESEEYERRGPRGPRGPRGKRGRRGPRGHRGKKGRSGIHLLKSFLDGVNMGRERSHAPMRWDMQQQQQPLVVDGYLSSMDGDDADRKKRKYRRHLMEDGVMEKCVVDEGNEICLRYDEDEEQIVVESTMITDGDGDAVEIERMRDVEKYEWENVMVGECNEDELWWDVGIKQICLKKVDGEDGDLRIVVKGDMDEMNVGLLDETKWNEIYFVNEDEAKLCRYWLHNKFCVEFRIDMNSNLIKKVDKISIENSIL